MLATLSVGARRVAISRETTLGLWYAPSGIPWYLPGSDLAAHLIRLTGDPADRARLRSLLEFCREQVRRDVGLPELLARVGGVQFVDDLAFEQAMEEGYRALVASRWSVGRRLFRRRFPLGVVRVSSPCYSDDRRLALVLTEEHRAPLWSVAHVHLLKRKGAVWTVVRKLRIWRS